MAIVYKLRCPDCAETFRWAGDEFPEFCPKCGADVSLDSEFVPSKVNIGTVKGAVVDRTYRAVEASSIARAEMAGDPALKVTNMRDNLREGDVAAMPVNNPVTQYADEMRHQYFQGNIQSEIANTKMGGERRTGSYALQAIQGDRVVPAVPKLIRGKFGGA